MVPQNQNLNFVPSQDTKKTWPYTFSLGNNYGGVQLPGLFKTSLFPLHAFCFGIIVFGELYGYIKIRELGTGSISQIFLGLIGVDFFLVLISIRLLGPINRIENLLVLITDESNKNILQRKKWILENMYLLFIKLLLALIAIFKIFAYIDLKQIELSELLFHGDAVPIIVLYIIVAILHMYTTAYFFTYCFLYLRIKFEEIKYGNKRNNSNLNISKHILNLLPSDVNFTDARERASLNSHFITKKIVDSTDNTTLIEDPDINTKEQYKLITWGILTDRQLENLIWQQKYDNQRRELALAGLEHQLSLIGIKKENIDSV